MNSEKNYRTIVAFVSDLYFQSKIEITIEGMGFTVTWFEKVEDIGQERYVTPVRQYAEHLVGPGATLIEKLTDIHPILIIFDLNNSFVPWKDWIALIKSAPATRRIPVLCYGSHVDVEKLQVAKDAGADAVLSRSRFITDMPKLINKYARSFDFRAIEETCTNPLSTLAIKGFEEFNKGKYFEAHETLEQAWIEDASIGRELYRAILQISVAYLQIRRGNYRGAIKMFLRVRQWIDPLPDTCRGVNIAKLRADALRVNQVLKELGAEQISSFDISLLKPIEYKN